MVAYLSVCSPAWFVVSCNSAVILRRFMKGRCTDMSVLELLNSIIIFYLYVCLSDDVLWWWMRSICGMWERCVIDDMIDYFGGIGTDSPYRLPACRSKSILSSSVLSQLTAVWVSAVWSMYDCDVLKYLLINYIDHNVIFFIV